MAYVTLPSLSANQVITASYMNQLANNIRVIGLHDHSGSAGEGNVNVTVAASAGSPYVYRQEILFHSAPSQSNFNTSALDTTYVSFAYRQTDTACPASIMYPLGLFSGTYNVKIMHPKTASLGIASVLIGSSVLGEIDMYSATASKNLTSTLSASIPTTASYTFTVRTDGSKNASSSGSTVILQMAHIRRIGNL